VLGITAVLASSAWTIILAMFCWLGFMLSRGYDAVFIAIWAGNILILLWKHRSSLGEPVMLRSYLASLIRRNTPLPPNRG
jgi:hypothetical protein